MDHTIPAIFDAGVFRPLEPVDLAQGTQVQVRVPRTAEAASDDNQPGTAPSAALSWPNFVEQTYGSCAGLGLERHEQGD